MYIYICPDLLSHSTVFRVCPATTERLRRSDEFGENSNIQQWCAQCFRRVLHDRHGAARPLSFYYCGGTPYLRIFLTSVLVALTLVKYLRVAAGSVFVEVRVKMRNW